MIEVLDNNLKYCNWANRQTVKSYLLELESEVQELKAGINNNDHENIIEEVADILFDSLVLAKLAEREYNIKIDTLLEKGIQKMRRRKPYIFEKRRVTEEEAKRLWIEAKEKEKKIPKISQKNVPRYPTPQII